MVFQQNFERLKFASEYGLESCFKLLPEEVGAELYYHANTLGNSKDAGVALTFGLVGFLSGQEYTLKKIGDKNG